MPQPLVALATGAILALLVATAPGCSSPAEEAGPASQAGDEQPDEPVGVSGPGRLVDATADLGLEEPLLGIRGHAVASADVNGDGWDDLFVGTFADREVDDYRQRGADGPAPDRLLLGSAAGFTVDDDFEGRLGRTTGAVFADLDGDGDEDLVVSRNVRDVERGDAPSEIYRNDDGQLVPATVLEQRLGGRAVVTLDVDGDGALDIVQVEDRWSGGSTVVLRNDGELRFSDANDASGFPDDVAGLGAAVGDLNGDGIDDLVVGGSNRWFLGDGSGLVEGAGSPLPWELHGEEDDPAQVALADLDADGDLDILVGQHFNSTIDAARPEPVRLYRNDGADQPTFVDVSDEAALPPLATKSPQVLLVDLDLDGTVELVTTASREGEDGERQPIVLHDSATTTESAASDRAGLPSYDQPDGPVGPHYWIDAVSLDANGDGRPDLFFVEWEPSLGSRLFLNLPQ